MWAATSSSPAPASTFTRTKFPWRWPRRPGLPTICPNARGTSPACASASPCSRTSRRSCTACAHGAPAAHAGLFVVTVDSDHGPVAIMGDVMHDYVNLERWWPGTSNNYWNIDDLVRPTTACARKAHRPARSRLAALGRAPGRAGDLVAYPGAPACGPDGSLEIGACAGPQWSPTLAPPREDTSCECFATADLPALHHAAGRSVRSAGLSQDQPDVRSLHAGDASPRAVVRMVCGRVGRRSGGNITMKIFWAESMGKSRELLNLVGQGAVDVAATPASYFPTQLPFLWHPARCRSRSTPTGRATS